MSTRSGHGTLSRLVSGLGLLAILGVAGLVQHLAPAEDDWQAPIPVVGAVGERLEGRNIAATVTDARLADVVSSQNGWVGETEGVWLVVDASVEAVVDETVGARLATTSLRIGDDEFSASTRPGFDSLADASLSVGIPLTGVLVFELPADLLDRQGVSEATLQLGAATDVRLDSVVEVPLDLGAVDHPSTVTFDEPEWGDG